MDSSNNNARLPNLSRLSVAILEKYISPFIGDQAIGLLKEPHKRQLFINSLKNALKKAEIVFIQKNIDRDIRDLLLQLPLGDDSDLTGALLEFSSTPSSQSLENLLTKRITGYAPLLGEGRVNAAVQNYIGILRYELLSIPEVRETLIAWATISSSQSLKDVEKNSSFALDELRQIAENTRELINVAKQKTPQNEPLNEDCFYAAHNKIKKNEFTESYIERDADKKLIRELKNGGVTITIKGPSRMGKSLVVKKVLNKITRQNIIIDFSEFDNYIFQSVSGFYRRFCQSIVIQLGTKSRIIEQWDATIAPTLLATDFFEKEVFKHTKGAPLILAIDNADRLVGTELKADFFPLLRYWSNQRSERRGWENLDLIIVISTEPKFLIANSAESPFNVSTIINVREFTFDQIVELNSSYKELFSAGELNLLFKLLNGHPYLTQLAFASICSGQSNSKKLLTNPLEPGNPFLPFLEALLLDLMSSAGLLDAIRYIIYHHTFPSNNDAVHRLQSLGIIYLAQNQILLRNELYRMYFQATL